MKLQLCFSLYKLAFEARRIMKYNSKDKTALMKENKMMLYNSEMIGNIQLSTEVLYQLLGEKDDRKYFGMILMEMVKIGCKFKEMNQLCRIGYEWYIDKEVYYDKVLGIDEDEVMKKFAIDSSKVDTFLTIKPRKSNVYVPIRNDRKIPLPRQLMKYATQNISKGEEVQFGNPLSLLCYKYIGEVLYFIRPGIYLSLLIAFKDQPYISFIASALIDGITLLLFQFKEKYLKSFTLRKTFYYEKRHRLMKLFTYLLREPIYTKITLKIITKIFNCLYIPRFIQSFLYDLLSYYRHIYFIA